MCGHKINQNMEFGDIIYLIILLFFMILGFFNDSRKKKNRQGKKAGGNADSFLEERVETILQTLENEKKKRKTSVLPPVPADYSGKDVHRTFQSSMDLVTDFEGQSSLKSSIFVYDADSSFALDTDSSDIFNKKAPADRQRSVVHPLIADLLGDGGREELKKGLVYGEILRRKH